MVIVRTIVAVIVGYVVFAALSMLLVGWVVGTQGAVLVLLGLVALALIGLIAGWLAALIAGSKARIATTVVAALVALATLANLFMGLSAEPNWYKVGTLILTAGAILLVGYRRQAGAA